MLALSNRTQRASLFLTALVVFGVEACGGDSNGALFSSLPNNHPSGATGGATTGTGGDASGGSENRGSGGASVAGAPGGAASGGTPTAGSSGVPAKGGAANGGAVGSSGGNHATGGSSAAGGKADGGSAGGDPVPDAGAGGNGDSGSGAGGAPPPDSGNGSGGSLGGDAKIRCGDTACDKSAGEICCIKEGMQKVTATCATSAMGCARVFRCDSDADCARGETCCMEFPNATNTPSTACARTCDTPLSCSVPEDCPGGQTCCGAIVQGDMSGIRYDSVVCQDRCGQATAQSTAFCTDSSVCTGNFSCAQSQTLPPGYLVCR